VKEHLVTKLSQIHTVAYQHHGQDKIWCSNQKEVCQQIKHPSTEDPTEKQETSYDRIKDVN